MEDFSLNQLYFIKEQMTKYGLMTNEKYIDLCEKISHCEKILEDSATGGPVCGGGLGAVANSQPSSLAGATNGPNWSSNGGTPGSGDIDVAYNAGVGKRTTIFQKIPIPMGSNHGQMTSKKSRKKRLDRKSLKNSFSKIQDYGDKEKKVMNFDEFSAKADINTIKK